ncbi:hypothetical protein K3495_g12868 [Podosphaera aphanis]|nr:hypothetical protein K3495_g12868 [Podosphaera aphanis]
MATPQTPSEDNMEITTPADIDLASQPRLDSSIWANKSNNINGTPTTPKSKSKTSGPNVKSKTSKKEGPSKPGKVTKTKSKKKTSPPPPPMVQFNNIDLSSDPISSLDFTQGPNLFMEPRTPHNRKRPLYISTEGPQTPRKVLKMITAEDTTKQCGCLCLLHSSQNIDLNMDSTPHPVRTTESNKPTNSYVSPTSPATPSPSPCPHPPTNASCPLSKSKLSPTTPSVSSPSSTILCCSPSTTTTTSVTSSPSGPTKTTLGTNRTGFNSAEEALFAARDNIVEAYKLTSDRKFQTQILDFLNIFREYSQNNFKSLPLNEKQAPKTQATFNTCSTKEYIAHPSHINNNWRGNHGLGDMGQSFAKVLATAPAKSSTSSLPFSQKTGPCPPPNEDPSQEKKVITIVITKGSSVPVHQPTQLRDAVNKAMGKIAISRVHVSPKNNLVLTCFKSNPEELLKNQSKWEKVFAGWPISKIQQIENWPTVVVHGIPSFIPITAIPQEISSFNHNISVPRVVRWLTGPPKGNHGSIVVTVGSEEEKDRILKTGILIGGLLLRAVNFKSSTERTLCTNCLKYGHSKLTCKRNPICAICSKNHLTSLHSCSQCKS